MKLTIIDTVHSGDVLAKSIYSEDGQVLLAKGVSLTERMKHRLKEMGIHHVFIEDSRTEGIEPVDVLSEETRRTAVKTVHETMKQLMNANSISRPLVMRDVGKKFKEVITTVLEDIEAQPSAMLGVVNLYVKDGYLYHHSVNVATYCLTLGISLGLNRKELVDLGVGAILHDIGKTQVPIEILNKPGKLTPEEWDWINSHPQLGFDLLRSQYDISLHSAHVALQHHERMDGTGYPRGLQGNTIHLYGKIAAIADVYEAMTGKRSYKKPYPPHEALEYIMANGGKHFDYGLVQLFCRHVAPYPVSTPVLLSTGAAGIVSAVSAEAPTRPQVRVLTDPSGKSLSAPYEIDLSQILDITIIATDMDISLGELPAQSRNSIA